MSNVTIGQGACPTPFLALSSFPYAGGFAEGRQCATIPSAEGLVSCCLPCPATAWVYADDFNRLTGVTNWLNVGSAACCVLLLLSFIVLPVQRTHRHYLTICLVVALCIMSLAFIIPLGSQPKQCHDAITPNDLHSDLSCAFSGAFVVFGGFTAVMWVFLRSLSLHLQICWQMVPGRKFAISALVAGWGVPAISLALVLTLSGVSYRFGTTCHINHTNSIQTFWGPMLAFAGSAAILQFVTCGYCVRVYVRSLMYPDETSQTSSNLPSYHGSVRTVTAKAAYRRVQKVIALQWRGIMIVLIIIADVIFFTVVFVKMDDSTTAAQNNVANELPWLLCLVESAGNKNSCLGLASHLVMNEATVMAVLYLLSLNGFWSVLFLGRWSMVIGWLDTIRRPFNRSHDFVSVDARRISDPRNYEMLTSPPQQAHIPKTFDDLEASPEIEHHSPRDWSPSPPQNGYFGREATYRSNSLSFSAPKPPSRAGSESGNGLSQGRKQGASAWAKESVTSPTILERADSVQGNNRSNSALGAERSTSVLGRDQTGSALGWERSGSALGQIGADRSGSALGRERDARNLAQRERASPTPRRANSALGRDWDPRTTYARGAGPERADATLGYQWNTGNSYARGPGDPGR